MKANENDIFDVDAQLDEFFGKEGTPERRAAEEKVKSLISNIGHSQPSENQQSESIIYID